MEINWTEIDQTLTDGGRIRTQDFAEANGIKVPEARNLLIERYGDSIEFRRGRNGGVYLREGATLAV